MTILNNARMDEATSTKLKTKSGLPKTMAYAGIDQCGTADKVASVELTSGRRIIFKETFDEYIKSNKILSPRNILAGGVVLIGVASIAIGYGLSKRRKLDQERIHKPESTIEPDEETQSYDESSKRSKNLMDIIRSFRRAGIEDRASEIQSGVDEINENTEKYEDDRRKKGFKTN